MSSSSSSSSNHFHLTLPSNASMDIFPDNTAAQYVTKLPKRLELNGDWTVSLKEISMPLTFINIESDVYKFQLRRRLDAEAEPEEMALPVGYYPSVSDIILKLNELTNPYGIAFRLSVVRGNNNNNNNNANNRKIKITVGDTYIFRPNEELAALLKTRPRDHRKGEHMTREFMRLPAAKPINILYVYCDILENVIVGDVTAPLLRIVEVRLNLKRAIMHTIINTPLFVPIQKKSFDTIEIWIMTETGETAPFGDGKSHIVLEFKKSTVLDGLV